MANSKGKPIRQSTAYALSYACALPTLQKIAKKHGYCLAVHGSMSTDLDLLACPWTEKASDPDVLVEAIKKCVGGMYAYCRDAEGEQDVAMIRPHGRKSYTVLPSDLFLGVPRLRFVPWLDISVMPKKDNKPQSPRVAVVVIVYKDFDILLGKRLKKFGENTYSFPGGSLEFGESFKECGIREVFEETGLEIETNGEVVFTCSEGNDDEHWVTLFLIGTYKSGELTNKEPSKCAGWEWYRWENMPENLMHGIVELRKHLMIAQYT